MIDGLNENSLYYKAYYLLRRPLIDMMFRGVAWDEKSAAIEKEKLSARKEAIKSEIFEISGTELWTTTSHRSADLIVLYSLQRDIRADYTAIPKSDRKGRKDFKNVVTAIGEAIRDCVSEGRGKSYVVGDGLSDQKIANYLYGDLKLPPFKKRRKDSGKVTITVDDTALKKTKMRFPEHAKVLDLIIEHRRCGKLVSTYLNADKLLSPRDGRFHSHYKPHGTQSLRLSSSGDPDGHGGNSQNQDREFKWLFLPR